MHALRRQGSLRGGLFNKKLKAETLKAETRTLASKQRSRTERESACSSGSLVTAIRALRDVKETHTLVAEIKILLEFPKLVS